MDGISGIGECVAERDPYYLPETNGTVAQVLKDFLVPLAFGAELGHPRDLAPALARVRGHEMAKAALEMAVWELWARREGVPLHRVLGGRGGAILAGVSVGLQAGVGWWMVSSGLSERVSVAPERLMIHLSLALLLFMGLLWCGFEAWAGQGRLDARGPWARGGLGLTVLIFIQSMLGALVAANQAGKVYNDWPLMNGRFFPADYAADGLWQTLAHSHAAVQFNHRIFGYLVFFLLIAFAVTARRSRLVQPQVRAGAYLLSGLGVFQVCLGVATVLMVAPLWLSISHQIVATLLLGVSVWLTWRARRL